MLTDSKAFSSFSVDDMPRAQQFYSEMLGLRVTKVPDMEGLLTLHVTGDRDVLVYGKPDHPPASFTILNSRWKASSGQSTPLSTGGALRAI